jgi:hypothetical protein
MLAMNRPLDPTHRTFVSYIDKSREYYAARGTANPYRWAHFEEVPFAALPRPLSQCLVTLITTAHLIPAGEHTWRHEVYSVASDRRPDGLTTDGLYWDRHATHTEDPESFFPLQRLHECARAGRIGGLARRLHGVPTEYSQRSTRERDAPEILRRCREDGADAALLVPL